MRVQIEVAEGGKTCVVTGSNVLENGSVTVSGKQIHWRPNGAGRGSQVSAPQKPGKYYLTLKRGSLAIG